MSIFYITIVVSFLIEEVLELFSSHRLLYCKCGFTKYNDVIPKA